MSHTNQLILVMTVVTFLVRVIPLTILRKPVTNPFLKSFLTYVPYVSLAVMTFPAILYATNSMISGAIAFITGIVLTWNKASLLQTAAGCCAAVLIAELFL